VRVPPVCEGVVVVDGVGCVVAPTALVGGADTSRADAVGVCVSPLAPTGESSAAFVDGGAVVESVNNKLRNTYTSTERTPGKICAYANNHIHVNIANNGKNIAICEQ